MMSVLTDDEISEAGRDCFWPLDEDAPKFARAIEAAVLAKLREQEPLTDDARELIGAMVSELRQHRWCGDCYPENGWPEVNKVLADYAKFKRQRSAAPQPAVVQVPQGWKLVPSRCPLCDYQHGHQIGCENNPVDIRLRQAATTEAPAQGEQAVEPVRDERAAFEAWVAKVQPAYWRAEAWQTEAWAMWQSISAALGSKERQPSVPAPWREAVKVALGEIAWSNDSKWQADRARAALAQLSDHTEQHLEMVPAPWREAVKVAREALEEAAQMFDQHDAALEVITAAIAQLDALEGGE